MKMGAIVAGASEQDQEHIYNFGKLLGIAFQLQDDYLDAFGDPKTFGKQVGGDIIENKKTYLYLKAIEVLDPIKKTQLEQLFTVNLKDNVEKIETVKEAFISSGSATATQNEIENYTKQAFSVLDTLSISEEKKTILKQFGNALMTRKV
jgi:geranylgeranyl diphosphate synthase type II